MPSVHIDEKQTICPVFFPGGAPTRRSAARRLPRRRRYHCDPMSVLPTTQQQRLATFRAPACQRYYAARLAAESPHPSTFDLPRGIFHPSTSGTKMLVKRAWTYEDVAADPDTFELVRHPSREPFTLPVWVQHALRTILAAQGPAARLAKARPLYADPHGATVCQSVRRPACGLARAGGVEVWHYHAQRSAVAPHATQPVEGSRL